MTKFQGQLVIYFMGLFEKHMIADILKLFNPCTFQTTAFRFISPNNCTMLNVLNIKGLSPTCFGESVLSSGTIKCQF